MSTPGEICESYLVRCISRVAHPSYPHDPPKNGAGRVVFLRASLLRKIIRPVFPSAAREASPTLQWAGPRPPNWWAPTPRCRSCRGHGGTPCNDGRQRSSAPRARFCWTRQSQPSASESKDRQKMEGRSQPTQCGRTLKSAAADRQVLTCAQVDKARIVPSVRLRLSRRRGPGKCVKQRKYTGVVSRPRPDSHCSLKVRLPPRTSSNYFRQHMLHSEIMQSAGFDAISPEI